MPFWFSCSWYNLEREKSSKHRWKRNLTQKEEPQVASGSKGLRRDGSHVLQRTQKGRLRNRKRKLQLALK